MNKRIWKQVMLRDECCQYCGTTLNLQVHHIIFRSQSRAGVDDPNNCVVLCNDCHRKAHESRKWRQYWEKWKEARMSETTTANSGEQSDIAPSAD